MDSNLAALSNELEKAVDRAAPYVVAVHGRAYMASSGVLWRDGVVLTAEHALKRDEDLRVTLADGRTIDAKLAGRDPGTDLAVLTIAENPPVMEVRPPADLHPGRIVLSLGRSRDSGINASMGIVSAVSGEWRAWRGGRLDAYLRLDLTLFPASAGGPVVTPAGECIGIATGALSRVAPLAIPVATANRVADEILSKGRVTRAYLGVGAQPVPLPEHLKRELNREGKTAVIVLSVEPDSPAEKAGMVIGDLLLSLDGQAIGDIDDLQSALDRRLVGRAVKVVIIRAGKPAELDVVVTERGA